MRLLAVTVIASAVGLAACGENESAEQSVLPPTPTIWIQDNRFDPQGQTVEVGMKLTWLNKDEVAHDVDFVSGEAFDSDPIGRGKTIEYTPQQPGTISYVCSVHPTMTGTLVVE